MPHLDKTTFGTTKTDTFATQEGICPRQPVGSRYQVPLSLQDFLDLIKKVPVTIVEAVDALEGGLAEGFARLYPRLGLSAP